MKVPKKIKIGGFQWRVIESKDISIEGNCFGSTHTDTQKIFLEPGIPEQKRSQTLLHEIMHAIFWTSGLEKIHTGSHRLTEEELVNSLSMGLFQVIRDNKLDFKDK